MINTCSRRKARCDWLLHSGDSQVFVREHPFSYIVWVSSRWRLEFRIAKNRCFHSLLQTWLIVAACLVEVVTAVLVQQIKRANRQPRFVKTQQNNLRCFSNRGIHTAPEEFENAALFLRSGLPSTLIRHENWAFWKRSSHWRSLKTPGLHGFSVAGKHFEDEAFWKPRRNDVHVISLNQFFLNTNPNWPPGDCCVLKFFQRVDGALASGKSSGAYLQQISSCGRQLRDDNGKWHSTSGLKAWKILKID